MSEEYKKDEKMRDEEERSEEEDSQEEESQANHEAEDDKGDDWNMCPVSLQPITGDAWVTNWGFTYSEEAKAGLPIGARDPMNQQPITSWARNIKFEHARERNNKLKIEAAAWQQAFKRAKAGQTTLSKEEMLFLRQLLSDGKVEVVKRLLEGVTHLGLEKYPFSGMDARSFTTLSKALKGNKNVASCRVFVDESKQDMEDFTNFVRGNKNLTNLSFQSFNPSRESLESLTKALSTRDNFQQLSLDVLDFSPTGLTNVCQALKNNRDLQVLELSTCSGITHQIIDSLKSHPTLKKLIMGVIDERDVDAIVELLKANPRLQILDISNSNFLEDEWVKKLAAAIAEHPGLRSIGLNTIDSDPICTDEGARLFLDAIKENGRIIKFVITDEHDEEIIKDFDACLNARIPKTKEEKTSGKRKREEEISSSSSSSSSTTTTSEPSSSVTTTSSVFSAQGLMFSASSVPKPEDEEERHVKRGKQEKGEEEEQEREKESSNPVSRDPAIKSWGMPVRGIQKN